MLVTLNGKPRDIPDEATVAEVLERLELNLRQVAVEVNRQLIPREEHAQTPLHEGDHLEIVTLVGGG
jgi:sulfur carrier protein